MNPWMAMGFFEFILRLKYFKFFKLKKSLTNLFPTKHDQTHIVSFIWFFLVH
jgi:hypothetical protein